MTGFALTVLLIELTPGPNMAWLAMLGATQGRRTGFYAVAGITLGLALNGVLAAAGVALLLTTTPWLWQALRWAGAAMMLWLAIDAWRDADGGKGLADMPRRSVSRYFLMGALINLLNPKAFVFYVLVAPRFLGGGTLTFSSAMVLMAISVTIATLIHVGLVLLGERAYRWTNDPARTRIVRRMLAIVLVGVAGWFIISPGT